MRGDPGCYPVRQMEAGPRRRPAEWAAHLLHNGGGGQGAVQAGVARRGGALAAPPSLPRPRPHSQNDGPCPLLERDHGSWPQEKHLILRVPSVPRDAPPFVGDGVLPSSLRPRLSWFQFGDRVFCKVSRTYGRGRDISRVISHFTAKN